MSKSLFRQAVSIKNSTTYDDSVAAGATMESGAARLEDDLNNLRSQVNRIIGQTNWYDSLSDRDLKQVDDQLAELEAQKLLRRVAVLTDITVPASQNWQILSVADSEAPTQVAALGTSNGAVVAQSALNGAGFDVHELIEIAGADAIHPKNLLTVIDGDTGQPLQSSLRDVFGLLQFESTGSDQDEFDDASGGSRVKISYVRRTAAGDDLEACPVADIENKEVNYQYISRINLDALPEDSFLSDHVWVDQAAAVDVTLDRALDNQGATPATMETNIEIDMSTSTTWSFEDSDGSVLFWSLSNSDDTAANAALTVNVGTIDFDSDDVSFNNGVTIGFGKARPIDIGENDGVIESTAGDLEIAAFAELLMDDGHRSGSTYSTEMRLADASSEWDDFETQFGEVSLLAAIVDARTSSGRSKYHAILTGDVAANTNITGAGGSPNLDAQLGDYSGISGAFADQVDVYLDGQILRGAADATGNHDVYPGDSAANGDLKMEFDVESGSQIIMFVYGD